MRLASYIDSQQSKNAAKGIVKWRRPIGCVLFVIGIVYLLSLPRRDLSHKAFFDENALLAGVVRREFADPNTIAKYAENIGNFGSDEFGLVQWLEGEFIHLGLEAYTQNYSFIPPVTVQPEVSISGRNVYGVLRSGRSSSAEVIVLATPLQPDNRHGIAVMLTLAKYFNAKNFWAKDIIFLVTSQKEVGMQAWIDGYMGTESTGISSHPLTGRSGCIQAVVNLELPSATIQYANIIAEGVNGILPNMDLVTVIVHLCKMEGIETAFHVQWESLRGYTDPQTHYLSSLKTMVAIAAHQAPGLPLANHGLFLKHRIDAVTLRGVVGTTSKLNSLFNIARALEGTFRSVNNLLERLHHSEFFFYTTSTSSFVSIGLYMPPFGLMIAPVVLEALAQWLMARDPALTDPNKDPTADDSMRTVPPFPFPAVVRLFLSSLLSGILLYATPTLLAPLSPHSLVTILVTVALCSATLPPLMRSPSDGWRMAKTFALIFLILALVATAMMNFSLAVVMVMTLIPPSLWVEPLGERRVLWMMRVFSVIILCPLAVLVYLCALHHYTTIPQATVSELFFEGVAMAMRGVVHSYSSWHLIGSWLFPFVCVVVWPLWLMNWTVCCLQKPTNIQSHIASPSQSVCHAD
ncbi:glycosylphosphatidylinositol anchor attachment 1 protein-like [Halichondria panicea]|uniref:glycosylphosphatidylinositol anchor attachment 1 protein-like n=1 Tax=Halichondria panicea TaxID=6063 RepID=UPI00312BA533